MTELTQLWALHKWMKWLLQCFSLARAQNWQPIESQVPFNNGQIYVDGALPFGLRSAPKILTQPCYGDGRLIVPEVSRRSTSIGKPGRDVQDKSCDLLQRAATVFQPGHTFLHRLYDLLASVTS